MKTLLAAALIVSAAGAAQAQSPYYPDPRPYEQNNDNRYLPYGWPPQSPTYPQYPNYPNYPTYPQDPYRPGYPNYGQAEALYGIQVDRDRVRIRVSSNGCTRDGDFQVRSGGTSYSQTITFVRVRQDNCRSFAAGEVWLDFSYRELGLSRGEQFTLGNPLAPWMGR